MGLEVHVGGLFRAEPENADAARKPHEVVLRVVVDFGGRDTDAIISGPEFIKPETERDTQEYIPVPNLKALSGRVHCDHDSPRLLFHDPLDAPHHARFGVVPSSSMC